MPHQALALERAGQLEVRFDMLSISEIVRQRYEKIVRVGSEDFGFDFIHFDISIVFKIGRFRFRKGGIITSFSVYFFCFLPKSGIVCSLRIGKVHAM